MEYAKLKVTVTDRRNTVYRKSLWSVTVTYAPTSQHHPHLASQQPFHHKQNAKRNYQQQD